jgi:hypothetical protein
MKGESLLAQIDENRGQISIGNQVSVQISVQGARVERLLDRQSPQPSPCPTPVYIRPKKPVGFLDRERQLRLIDDSVSYDTPIELHGESGTGISTLLRHLAFYPPKISIPDGIVYLEQPREATSADLKICLYDCFYDRKNFIPTDTQIRRALQHIRALILLDHVTLSDRHEIESLLNTAPRCVFIIAASQQGLLWGIGHTLYIPCLPEDAAIELVNREIGQVISGEREKIIHDFVSIVGMNPLKIKRVATEIREKITSLKDISQVVSQSQNPDQALVKHSLNSLNEFEALVLAILALLDNAPLPTYHLKTLTDSPEIETVLRRLENRKLLQSHSPSYSLTGDLGTTLQEIWDLRQLAKNMLSYLADWATSQYRVGTNTLMDSMDASIAMLTWGKYLKRWNDVLRLVKAIEEPLARSGQWGRWGYVLNSGLKAAQSLGNSEKEAWALHQIGTRWGLLGKEKLARKNLSKAYRLRDMRDDKGASLTRHNFDLLDDYPSMTDFSDLGDSPKGGISENAKVKASEQQHILFKSTWNMKVLIRPADEFLAQWEERGSTPPSVQIPADHVIGLRPSDLTPDNFDTWARFLEKVERIYYLDLSNSDIVDANLEHLNHLHLEELDLSDTAITDKGLVCLQKIPGLMSLNLNDCKWVGDKGLEHLLSLTHLTRLYLKGTKVSNKGLAYLRNLSRMTHLVLRGTNLAGTGLMILEGLYDLRYLDISRTQVNDAGLLPICRFPYLETLLLEGCQNITESGIAHLTCLGRLRKLDLNDTNINDKSLEYIKQLTNLEEVKLARCWQITQTGIDALRHSGLRIILGDNHT